MPRFLMLVLVFVLLLQPACLFHKHKASAPQVPAAPIRITFLPLNIPAENADLRWVSMASPIMLAKVAENAPDLEVVPLWESMPIAAETAGGSRTITVEGAAYIASRLSAKWASQGELAPEKNEVSLILDFIPAKSSLVPFRYDTRRSVDSLGSGYRDALEQLLRYLVARPLARTEPRIPASLREIAEALDREYGWYAAAEPGKSEKIVAELARTDGRLARVLFSPTLYPSIGSQPAPAGSQPQAKTPSAAASPSQPTPDSSVSPVAARTPEHITGTNPSATPSPPPETPVAETPPSTLPPPKSFTQILNPAPLNGDLEGVAPKRTEKYPPPRAPAVKQSGTKRGFALQVYSSRNKENAEAAAKRLRDSGLTPEVEEVDLDGKGTWYRIRLHGYASLQQAKAAGQKLQSEKRILEFWVTP